MHKQIDQDLNENVAEAFLVAGPSLQPAWIRAYLHRMRLHNYDEPTLLQLV
jgi:hypothetical protein